MKYLLALLTLLLLYCSPCRNCTSYIVDRPQMERWRKNGVQIERVDTLKNNFYKVYIK